jgi:hypothetical protein
MSAKGPKLGKVARAAGLIAVDQREQASAAHPPRSL